MSFQKFLSLSLAPALLSATLLLVGCLPEAQTSTSLECEVDSVSQANDESSGDRDKEPCRAKSLHWDSVSFRHLMTVNSIAEDSKGNIYVGGSNSQADGVNLGDHGLVIVKYDKFGEKIAEFGFKGPQRDGGSYQRIDHLVIDKNDDIYAAITAVSGSALHIEMGCSWDTSFLAKMSQDGELLWLKKTSECSEGANDHAFNIGPSGNLYVAGQARSGLPGLTPRPFGQGISAAYLKVLDPNGNFLSTTRFETSFWDVPREIAFDSDGNVYVAGVTSSDLVMLTSSYTVKERLALNKFTSSGQPIWSKLLSGIPRSVYDVKLAVGEESVAVMSSEGWDRADLSLFVLDLAGNEIVGKVIEFPGTNGVHDIHMDNSGEMRALISEMHSDSEGLVSLRSYVAELSSDGNLLSTRKLSDSDKALPVQLTVSKNSKQVIAYLNDFGEQLHLLVKFPWKEARSAD